jgi:predicted nucleotidyltransferase
MNLEIRERWELLEAELNRIVSTLKKEYQPEKIILFGSFANMKLHEWSDLDIAIIKDTKEHFIDRLHTVSSMTKPSVGVNFVVYTPKEAQDMMDKGHYFFIDEILKKGKVLYERDE